jgi:hypothetical protein
VSLVREGVVSNSDALSKELLTRSGLPRLRTVLLAQFAERRDLLKARSGLLAVEAAARARPVAGSDRLLAAVEQIAAGAHELAELQLLAQLRSGAIPAKPDDLEEMERLIGGAGASMTVRLGLATDAGNGAVRAAAAEALARWQRSSESPMATREVADASRLLMRTCEAMLAAASG